MRWYQFPSFSGPPQRIIDAWLDGADTNRATLVLLGLFVAVWTTYHIIAQSSVGLHEDFLEVYAWSRHPAFGYPKHPPLGAWMAAAWFAVFPVAEWSFHLFSVVNVAIALFAIDRIASRYLSGDKRLLVLLLLLLTPFYQFFGHRFGTNATLLWAWPVATYCFLRAFETRGAMWSALAGVAAGVAMLGKYYSGFLIAGFVVAALTHPARWRYLKSPSPWISAACGLAVLAPHLHWAMASESRPIDYAFAAHGQYSLSQVLYRVGEYLLGGLAYMGLPVLLYLLAVKPSRANLKEALWSSDPDRRMLVVMLATFILLPAIVAPLLSIRLTPLWTMSAWFLLPIALLSPSTIVLQRSDARNIVAIALAAAVLPLLFSPAVAWYRHLHGTSNGDEYYRVAGGYVAAAWHQTVNAPLRIVMGSSDLAAAATFYSADHPDMVPSDNLAAAPWIKPQDVGRYGFAFVCKPQSWCIETLERHQKVHPASSRFGMELCNRYWGTPSRPQRVHVLIVPPAQAAAGEETRKLPPRLAAFDSTCKI